MGWEIIVPFYTVQGCRSIGVRLIYALTKCSQVIQTVFYFQFTHYTQLNNREFQIRKHGNVILNSKQILIQETALVKQSHRTLLLLQPPHSLRKTLLQHVPHEKIQPLHARKVGHGWRRPKNTGRPLVKQVSK